MASASHDLRQPIHALGLFFADLSERVRSAETEQVIGQIEDSISAINSMLNALLDVSKLDAGVVKPEIQSCALQEIFDRLKTEYQPVAKENNNILQFRASRLVVDTDPSMLERMLRNLIGNALRYTDNGRVLVGARLRGISANIQVFDTGGGIPEDQLEEVFVEFQQLHNAARDRRQGLGLGLAIVKRLANLLSHTVEVKSILGKGSCFSVLLPLSSAKWTSISERSSSNLHLPGTTLVGRQLLVLEDDVAVLESMCSLLSRWGCRIIAASTPAEAMNKLAASERPPDLLITDYRLPGNVSGIDVARTIHEHLGFSTGVLVITGDTGPERLREAEASGFPLLHKPVHPAKLRSTLQHLLGKPPKNRL